MDRTRLDGSESLQPDQCHCLISLLLDLRPWLENTPVAVAASEVQSRPVVAAPSRNRDYQALPPVKDGKLNVEPIRPVPLFKSIVEQIDDVLQAKLLVSPLKIAVSVWQRVPTAWNLSKMG